MRQMIVVMLLMFLGTGSARAQIPVTDAAAISKSIEQLLAWKKQYEQMLQQINLSRNQLNAMSGSRNLGAVVDNIGTTAGVPREIVDQWRALNRQEDLAREVLARTKAALEQTETRGMQVRALMQAMGNTSDVKAAQELQGRISAEVALVMTDMQRVQLMAIERQNNYDRLLEQQRALRRTQRNKPLATW